MRIVSNQNGYSFGSKKINIGSIQRLDRALTSNPIEKIDPSTLGITESWLKTNARMALDDVSRDDEIFRKHTVSQEQFFIGEFSNAKAVALALSNYYSGAEFWTDDYPEVSVSVKYSDGSSTTIESNAQQLYMLPWHQSGATRIYTTFNPDLSKAIAGLMPDDACNKSRLEPGDDFRSRLAQEILEQNQDKWDSLGATDVLGAQLRPIDSVFRVTQSVIFNGLGSNDVESMSPVWDAQLHDANLPPNMFIHLDLPVRDNKLENVDLFLKQIPATVELVSSVPWLSNYLATHPLASAHIRFAMDRSVSLRAQDGIQADFRSNEVGALSPEMKNRLNASALVEVDGDKDSDDFSVWVVLPDKSMLPWYFRGFSAAGYSYEQLDCVDGVYYYCRTIVQPNGSIKARN